jgi:hypothetical protein
MGFLAILGLLLGWKSEILRGVYGKGNWEAGGKICNSKKEKNRGETLPRYFSCYSSAIQTVAELLLEGPSE